MVRFLDGISDLYWAVNFEKHFWNSNNTNTNETAAHILTSISNYVTRKASWVLVEIYNMEKPKINKLHASKETPQYGFNRGIRKFGDEGREAMKQELYENLMRMNDVTMTKAENF